MTGIMSSFSPSTPTPKALTRDLELAKNAYKERDLSAMIDAHSAKKTESSRVENHAGEAGDFIKVRAGPDPEERDSRLAPTNSDLLF